MLRFLSILNFSLLLFFSHAESSFREPGATLPLSIRNEITHALLQSVDWLIAAQNPNGTWATNTTYETTALVLFALQSVRQPEASNACARAATWLATEPLPPNPPPKAIAWHLLANANATPNRAPAEISQSVAESPCTLLNEARYVTGLSRTIPAKRPAPSSLPPKDASMQCLWKNARALNAHPGLFPEWQTDFARRLITTQRRDPEGNGGFWRKTGKAPCALTETAYALLLMLEL